MGRILIARFHSLGDVILATGIAARFAGMGETVETATEERFLPLFEGLPLARVWTPDRLEGAGRFDRVVDLQANATSRRLLRGLGPTSRNRSRSLHRRLLVLWGSRGPALSIPHAVQRYAEAAGLAPDGAAALRPRIVVTEQDREEAAAFPRAWEASGRCCVGLAEGASRPMKRWPVGRFGELSRRLASQGVGSLRFQEPLEGSGEDPGTVRAPLRPLKALLARCAALVTNDSGVMHLAVGLGVPVVAIFGSTTTDFGFGPLGERDRVVERMLPCRPCAVHGARFCWQVHRRCLREVSVDEVLAAVNALAF